MKSHPAPDNTLPSLKLLRIVSPAKMSEKKYRKIASKWRTEFIKVSCNADIEEKADTYLLKAFLQLEQKPCPGQMCTEFKNTCLPQAIHNIKLRKNASSKKFIDEKISIRKYQILFFRWFNEYLKVFCDMKCRNPMTCFLKELLAGGIKW